jgi:hypothetical protein
MSGATIKQNQTDVAAVLPPLSLVPEYQTAKFPSGRSARFTPSFPE